MSNDDPQALLDRALRSKIRYPEPLNAVPIDGSGTRGHDDFLSYTRSGRQLSIIDAPAIFPINRHFIRNAFERFARGERRIFPPEVTSRFKVGDIIPTITFETRLKSKPRESESSPFVFERVGFGIFKSKVKMLDELDMLQVDLLYKGQKSPLIQSISLDPDLNHLFCRTSPNRFGEDLVYNMIDITNRDVLEWADSKGIPQIKYHVVDGKRFFFVSDEYVPDAQVKVTNPIRNFIAFINISIISTHITEREPVFSYDDLQLFADVANEREARRVSYIVPQEDRVAEATAEEVERFVDIVIKEGNTGFNAAKVLLTQKPIIAVHAITDIADNKYGFLKPKWEIARVRDVTIAVGGKPKTFSQVIIIQGDRELRTPIMPVNSSSRTVARVVAASEFWKRYFKDENFEKSYWVRQKRIEDFKIEHDKNWELGRGGGDKASSLGYHPRINHGPNAKSSQR